MKTFYSLSKAAICMLLFLNSCVSSKNSIEPSKIDTDASRDQNACFVQLKDGSIKNYSSLKLVTGVFKTPHLIADGNVTITTADIKAYQSKEYYAVSQKQFTNTKPSYVAVEALPGFAVRVAKGKLNVYSLKYYNGHNATEKFYLQSGDNGQIVAYTPAVMKELVKDNTDAYNFFNDKKKLTTFPKKLLATVDIYNNSPYVSKN